MIVYDGDLSMLSKHSIGVIKKVSYGKVLDTAIANKVFAKVVVSANGTENFQNLVAGKVDIVASNKYGGLYILKQLNKLDAAVELPKRLQTVSSYMAFSKKRNLSHIRDQFNVILKRLKKDGTYVNMLKSYFKK
ncbi:MAG: transporter substrate-binding domain-containing protein [Campylobacteraceae bacterium]|nr:transporter substrate-binding domain-containing protein [Campylobacteraceae bacterium]